MNTVYRDDKIYCERCANTGRQNPLPDCDWCYEQNIERRSLERDMKNDKQETPTEIYNRVRHELQQQGFEVADSAPPAEPEAVPPTEPAPASDTQPSPPSELSELAQSRIILEFALTRFAHSAIEAKDWSALSGAAKALGDLC